MQRSRTGVLLFTLMLGVAAWPAAGQITKYVIPGGSGAASGDTWADAYSNLQDAVVACAGAGDVICMRYGIYSNAIQVVFSKAPGLAIRGGYAGAAPEPGPLTNAPTVLTRGAGNARYLLNPASRAARSKEGSPCVSRFANASSSKPDTNSAV